MTTSQNIRICCACENIAYKWKIIDYLQNDARNKGCLRNANLTSFWHNLASILADDREIYVSFDENDEMVAYMVVRLLPYSRKDKIVELSFLEVLPNFQRKGIGTAMVNYVLDMARSKQQSGVTLVAANDSDPFWQKLYFQTTRIGGDYIYFF